MFTRPARLALFLEDIDFISIARIGFFLLK